MKKKYFHIVLQLTISVLFGQSEHNKSNSINYDFTFADVAIRYIETGKQDYLKILVDLPSTQHILAHAIHFENITPEKSTLDFVTDLLNPLTQKKKCLNDFKRNLAYTKRMVNSSDILEKVSLKYLPKNFQFSTNLYFTLGYDLGVVYGKNASINLAHPHYLKNKSEVRYYAVHELHHAGFMTVKNQNLPSFEIITYAEMLNRIEFYTQLEGMATYSVLDLRKEEKAIDSDLDYIVLEDYSKIQALEKEYFDIYNHFKANPNKILKEEDWDKLNILSNGKRLWYRVGAYMSRTIDKTLGREKLVSLISESPSTFISTYLKIKTMETNNSFSIIWRYTIHPDFKKTFEMEYGANGSWNALFKKSEGYLRSILFKGEKPNEYILIDYWQSKHDYEKFLKDFEKEYQGMSKRLQHLYKKEESLGRYIIVD